MTYTITKEFSWAMGHRVHNQSLDAELSCSSGCKCKMLHGHSYEAVVALSADELDKNMVMDFTDLKFVKAWIDNHLDHRFMLDRKDPELANLTFGMEGHLAAEAYGIQSLDPQKDGFVIKGKSLAHQDILKSFIVVDYVPTSEEIARHLFEYVKTSIPKGVTLTSVTIKESPTSSATYTGGKNVKA